MGEPALASDHNHVCNKQHNACLADPYGRPMLTTSPTLPTQPKPCARPQHTSSSRQSGSLSSSTTESEKSTPPSSVELEKSSWQKYELRVASPRQSRRSSRDPEKGVAHEGHHSPRRSYGAEMATRITFHAAEEDEEADEGRQIQEKRALKILVFLSGPCVLVSAMNAAWACIAIVITILSQPIRICAKRPTVGQQLAGLLSPTLNLQLRCIYTPLPPHANEDGSYDSLNLFAGHIFSPFLSFIVMFAAWLLAVYWATSAVIGDPAGQDKVDDGKETVLGLRKWWEKWLLRGVQNEQ